MQEITSILVENSDLPNAGFDYSWVASFVRDAITHRNVHITGRARLIRTLLIRNSTEFEFVTKLSLLHSLSFYV